MSKSIFGKLQPKIKVLGASSSWKCYEIGRLPPTSIPQATELVACDPLIFHPERSKNPSPQKKQLRFRVFQTAGAPYSMIMFFGWPPTAGILTLGMYSKGYETWVTLLKLLKARVASWNIFLHLKRLGSKQKWRAQPTWQVKTPCDLEREEWGNWNPSRFPGNEKNRYLEYPIEIDAKVLFFSGQPSNKMKPWKFGCKLCGKWCGKITDLNQKINIYRNGS